MIQIAYFSPLPPARSGIADYSAELLPHLAELAHITLFTDQPDLPDALRQQFAIRPTAAYPAEQWRHDLPLYQMGNSHHHESLYQMSLHYPGAVVLHDANLHEFMAHRSAGQSGYTREWGYAQGLDGINQIWRQRLTGQPAAAPPLHNRLLAVSRGLIVHSHFVRRGLAHPPAAIAVIPHQVTPQTGAPFPRTDLNWPADALIFAAFGQVTPAKQVEMALRAFARWQQAHPQLDGRFLIVGEWLEPADPAPLLAELGIAQRVHSTGYVADLADYRRWLNTADIILSLRYPTIGETSGAALRALGAGKPVIVFDHGWYGELPRTAVRQTAVMDEGALLAAMSELAASPELRQQLGAAGLAYVQDVCAPPKVAAAYAQFLHHCLEVG